MTNSLSIDSVAIPKPNIPLRDINGRANFRVSNLAIWQSGQPNDVTPASIGIGSTKQTTFNVTIQGPIPSGQTFTLSGEFLGEFLGNSVTKSILTIEATEFDSSNATVSVTVKGCLVNVPWGIQDTIEWRVDGENPTKTPIELYAITPSEFIPVYFQSEIPVELLQIFILPILNLAIDTHERFVEYTAIVCHKSKLDEDAIMKHTEYKPVHAYKYNSTGGGAPAFVSEYGGTFNLNKWLKNRYPRDDWPHVSINCFDQAGIVTLILSLGLPDSSTQLRWYVMYPYGYIDGDLVGVGKCNNPYFGEKLQGPESDPPHNSTQAGAEKYMKDATNARRSGFSNHVFNGIVTEKGERIIDACAGPHVGDQTLAEYLAAAIEKDNIPPSWDPKTAIDPGSRTKYCKTGSIDDPHWKSRIDGKPFVIDTLDNVIAPRSYESLTRSQKNIVDTLQSMSTVPNVNDTNRMDDVDLRVLTSDINHKLQEKGFGKYIEKLSATAIHLEWPHGISGDNAITVNMTFYRTYAQALSAMNDHLLSYTKSEFPLSMKGPSTKEIEANHYLAGPDVVMWVDSHILVRVCSVSPNGESSVELQKTTDIIHSLMSDAAKGPKLQNSGGVVLNPVGPSENPVVGSEFTITVEVSNGSEIEAITVPKDAELNTQARVLVIDKRVTPVDNSATFRFLPLSQGELAIKFLCGHFQTLEISERTVEITIEGEKA